MNAFVEPSQQLSQSILGAIRAPGSVTASMTSLEIADLLQVRHDNVRRSARRLVGIKGFELPPVEEVRNHLGQRVEIYRFEGAKGRRDCLLLVARLSPGFTAEVIDRWQELELMAAKPVSATEALQIALEIETQRVALASRLEEVERHAELLRNHFSEGMTISAFCRCLNGVNVQQVCTFLEGRDWLYRRDKKTYNWLVRSSVRDRYLTEVIEEYTTPNDCRAVLQRPVLLRAGAIKLFEMYREGLLPMKATWDGKYEHVKA